MNNLEIIGVPFLLKGNKFIHRKDVPIVDKLLDYKVKLMRKIYELGNGFEWNTPYDVQKDKYEDVALDTYLFNRNLQKKSFLNNGYIEGTPGDYGLVSKAVGNRNLPIYLKNKDDISRSDLTPIGNIYGDYLFNYKDLVHSGNSPSVIYTDSIGNIYFKKYDLHDYGTTSSNRYSNPIFKIASNLLDFIGNPVVLTTGIVKLDNEQDVLNLLLYVKKSGDINLYNSIINNYNKEPYKTIYNSYIEHRAYEVAPLYLRDKVNNGEYKEFYELVDKLKKEIPMDSVDYTEEDLKRYGIIQFKNGGIHIKKKNRGTFTKYCDGKVTQACIDKAKRSGNKKLVKRAVFAENSRKWAKKHFLGGVINIIGINPNLA